MSLNGVADLYPNTLSGLSSFNATNILLNGQDLTTIFVPFINSPSDVDLGAKDLVTTGKLQSTLLKLPSLTNATSKYLQLNSNKEVISTDLGLVYVPYTGSTANLDMGAFAVKSSYIPIANADMINKRYADITLLTQADASNTYLSQANASVIYVPYSNATSALNMGVFAVKSSFVPNTSDSLVNKNYVDVNFLTQTDASSIYLSQANATLVYLTQSNASSIYATITNLALKANLASPTFTGTVSGITSAMVGLGNVDNTSDANKPVSTATQTALNLKADLASPTFTGIPVSTTASPGTNTTQIATTAFVTSAVSGAGVSSFSAGSTGFTPNTATTGAVVLAGTLNVSNGGTGVTSSTGSTSVVLSASPTLTGVPLAPTASPGTNTTQIATTAFVTTAVSGTGVSSFSGGTTGLLPNTATTGAITLSGTLAVANGGTGNTTGTLAYLGNTQTFSGVNTFSDQMTLTKAFDLTLGSINSFVVRNSSLVTQFTVTNTGVTMGNLVMTGNTLNMSNTAGINTIYSGDSLGISASATTSKNIYMTVAGTALQLDQYGLALSSSTKTLYCNLIEGLSSLGITMQGGNDCAFKINNTLNASSQPVGWDFKTMYGSYPSYTTNARISGLGVGTDTLYSFGSNALNIQNSSTINYGATTAHKFTVSSVSAFAISADGLWMPASSSRSFYITDTYPNIGTSVYGRLFGTSQNIIFDFYNSFVWRRSPNANGSSVVDLMAINNDGLTLYNAPSAGQPQLNFLGSGTPNIKASGSAYNWFIGGTQCGYFDYPGGNWRISTNSTQKLILCSGGQNTLQCGNGGLGNYPVEIYGARLVNGNYWQYTGGGATWSAVDRGYNIGLYVQYAVSADGGYLLASDERIKQDIKPAESGSLEVISTIPIKSYSYIDPFVNGCSTAYSVIAQDIQRTYPEAITKGDGFIPDMFVKCNWIHVDEKQIEINIPKLHTVKAGDKVKLILEDSTYKEALVTAIKDDSTFSVQKWDEFKLEISDELFVYGKYINDFLRVDKIRLGVLALAGTKELHQIVKLQQAKIEEQSQAINTLTESMKFLTEHLATLTTAFNKIVKE